VICRVLGPSRSHNGLWMASREVRWRFEVLCWVLRSPDRSLRAYERLPTELRFGSDGCRRTLRSPETPGMFEEKLGGFVVMEGAGNTLDVS